MGRSGANFSEDLNFEQEQTKLLQQVGAIPSEYTVMRGRFPPYDLKNMVTDHTIELKIVRWPTYTYSDMTLESYSKLEEEKPGWMKYCEADELWYLFQQKNDGWIKYAYEMPALQLWFWKTLWPTLDTDSEARTWNERGNYTTLCHKVSMHDVPLEIRIIDGEYIPPYIGN